MATVSMPLRISPAHHGRTMTLDEFEEADFEEDYRYELARGVLEVSEIPGELHGVIVWILLSAIRDYQRDHPSVIYRAGGGTEYRFRLPVMQSGRHPDVAATLRNTPRDSHGFRRAAMAFEVVSEGAEARERDYVTNRAEYLAYGLLDY
jgi:Uma2 family endonuclease